MTTEFTQKDAEQDRAIMALSHKLDELSKITRSLEQGLLAKMAASNELIAEDIRTLGKHIVEIKISAELKRGVTPLSTQLNLNANK